MQTIEPNFEQEATNQECPHIGPATQPEAAEPIAEPAAEPEAEMPGAPAATEPAQPEVQPEPTPADPLEQLTLQLEETNEKLLRLMAEFDNFRKRTQREREAVFGDAQALVLTKLLPVLDNFARALESGCTDEAFAKGIGMIHTSLLAAVEGFGLAELGTPGETFDPNLHHAVQHIDDETLGENVVAEVLQKGYKMGERVLRPAMVKTAN